MKGKLVLSILTLLAFATLGGFAESYSNNEYLKKSLELGELSNTAFNSGDYDAAASYAREARDWALRSDAYVAAALEEARQAAAKAAAEKALALAAAKTDWPATYRVRLIPERRDCLWRIAEYSFIYNDPLRWPLLYEANKKNFRDPSNPNLIFPGQVLVIPSLAGETRRGGYDPSVTYEVFTKLKK